MNEMLFCIFTAHVKGPEETYLALYSSPGGGVPNVVRHFVTTKPEQVLLLDAVRLLAGQRLPGGLVEPGTPHDVERFAGPVYRVAFPLGLVEKR